MTSIVAVPGVFASLYVLGIAATTVFSGEHLEGDANSFFFVLLLPVLGWWLYWTYWLETQNKNRWGKLTWLISALTNGVPVVALVLEPSSIHSPFVWVALLWGTVVAVISGWVWVLLFRR